MKIVALAFLLLVFIFASCEKTQSSKETSEVFLDKEGILKSSNLTQDQNMSEYDKGGHFWCRTRISGKFGNENDRLEGEKKVRDFIWQHWTEKKLGYIILSCPDTDTQNTSHYFIEPDEKGIWKITEKHFYQSSNDKFIANESVFYALERVENKEKGDWYLIVKTSNGDFSQTIPLYP